MPQKTETQEQQAARNERVKKYAMFCITDGGVSHDVWITRSIGLPGMEEQIPPVVEMANNDDGYYMQTFRNREELEIFIKTLQDAANEAWPKDGNETPCDA